MLQQVPGEGPGLFAGFMRQSDVPFDTVVLSRGDSIPSLAGYDALVALGGPMNVYQEQEYPFLVDEGRAIAQALDMGLPYLGICLGGQLLAKALAAPVAANAVAEIGFDEVDLTPEGAAAPLFRGLGPRLPVLQWHQDTFAIPQGAVRLAGSDRCRNQAFRYGRNAYALQFHLETTAEMVRNWVEDYDPAGSEARAVQELRATDMAAAAGRLEAPARILFRNFLGIAGKAPGQPRRS